MTTLADELVLICYSDEGKPSFTHPILGYGVTGALLTELVLAGRVDLADKKVVVTDPTPTGEPAVDALLARLAEADKPRKPQQWMHKLYKESTTKVLDGLVERGVVRREAAKVLLVFPTTRYPTPDGRQPALEADARARLRAALEGDGPVDERTAALCALIGAARQERKVLPDVPKDRLKARLKEIGEGAWASEAVRKAIDEIQLALVAGAAVAAAGA
ncbi:MULTISPECIES: GPP34 family phosphoprotein [Actinosynnema]|uniref:GOLPH3/VPS74 family protein n=1 Tax=Actinosynnema TaxID=40566 RepID=UPI0020A4880E|nr:GPP34 family phosphoprotein [Actinosynnema pretiosum]MCP2093422.1 Golgi phosphoprotein 3 (GPP34) [Actinosynnema pretiosum]